MQKKGVSPVIATVLLIGIVVVLGLIIFIWFKGFIQEEGTKFGKNIKLVCEDVDFNVGYSSGVLSVVNTGNVPLFRVKIKIVEEGSYETRDLKDLSDWPETGLNQGESFSGSILSTVSGKDKIIAIPVLIGSSGTGEKVFTCDEQYGHEINL